MRYIVDKDARVTVRGVLLFLPRGWIVTDEPPPRRPQWSGAIVQTGTMHVDETALAEIVRAGAPLSEVGGDAPMEQCPHCGKSFISRWAPPPVLSSEPVVKLEDIHSSSPAKEPVRKKA